MIAEYDQSVRARAPFATPAALVAMKLHAIETRGTNGQDKRASEAWDLYRLLVDLDADGSVQTALAAAPPNLKQLIHDAAHRVLVAGADRTRGWLRSGDNRMSTVTAEYLRFELAELAKQTLDAHWRGERAREFEVMGWAM